MNFNNKKDLYNENEIFNTLEVKINTNPIETSDYELYTLSNISTNKDNLKKEFYNSEIIDRKIKSINEKMKVIEKISSEHESWSAFYTLKEIIDIIRDSIPQNMFDLYYRGQAGGWPLTPSLFREVYDDEFRKNFEDIYKNIALKYPDKISYIEDSGSDERVCNLAELQHYGLGTPLVDLTSNPFIAMLFMVNGYNPDDTNNPNPDLKFEVYIIDKHNDNSHLFQEVRKNNNNIRIDAQHGAFLNFEKLYTDENDELMNGDAYINRISISITCNNREKTKSEEWLPDKTSDQADSNISVARRTIARDFNKKLSSYGYTSDELFPDFYLYLQGINKKYSKNYENDINEWRLSNEV